MVRIAIYIAYKRTFSRPEIVVREEEESDEDELVERDRLECRDLNKAKNIFVE